MNKQLELDALKYHSEGKPGKVEVTPTKPCDTQHALSLAYSPGVAAPCLEIHKTPSTVYDYTSKGNLVAVISNGTAVLGLGNIGPLASKPVMEGKGVLFKKFAFVDVFDIEVKSSSNDEFINAVKTLEPTFGGINLEDIKAPECFEIEERLKKEMNIPVFHDDQHGTAIISGAALLNACLITHRKLEDIKLVVNGAGAAAISCSRIFVALGVKKENITMCDSKGVIYKGRKDGMNKYKDEFAINTSARTLTDAIKGSDVFVGLSVAGVVTEEMLKSMAANPIVFAMANPDPEIEPPAALNIRNDVIMATGRSDYPNQVNNVLGFPYIFRGALDVRATTINEEMKLAAVNALAQLARENVPEQVSTAYENKQFEFGREYIIPKPFDERVLLWVAPAVAKAAMDTGVAQRPIDDFDLYREHLEALQGQNKSFIRHAIHRIKEKIKSTGKIPKIVFPNGENEKLLRAVDQLAKEKIIEPIFIGNPESIKTRITQLSLKNLESSQIVNNKQNNFIETLSKKLLDLRKNKGMNITLAKELIHEPNYLATLMTHENIVDGVIVLAETDYTETLKPVLQILGQKEKEPAFGLSIILHENEILFLADTVVNLEPTKDDLAKISTRATHTAHLLGFSPKTASLSYHQTSDGSMPADQVLSSHRAQANILLFPNLQSANISSKMASQLGSCEVLYPMILGTKKPVNVLEANATVENLLQAITLTSLLI